MAHAGNLLQYLADLQLRAIFGMLHLVALLLDVFQSLPGNLQSPRRLGPPDLGMLHLVTLAEDVLQPLSRNLQESMPPVATTSDCPPEALNHNALLIIVLLKGCSCEVSRHICCKLRCCNEAVQPCLDEASQELHTGVCTAMMVSHFSTVSGSSFQVSAPQFPKVFWCRGSCKAGFSPIYGWQVRDKHPTL